MPLIVAGMFGIGGPEVMAVLILGCIAFAIRKNVKRPNTFSRYCPQCGRGLTQQPDAPFCGYCGNRLP
jgi:rRNA maturation endonuclease Nob1